MSRGVTLIELIVVMALVAVMLGVVGPSLSGSIDNLVLSSESRRVLSAFRMAQTTARTSGQPVFATHNETSLQFLKSDHAYQTINMPSGVRFVSTDKEPPVVFLDSGQIVGPDSLDMINGRGRRVRLSIDHSTGLIKLVNSNS
jgi:prepilin-type N-terminal cleavage/methylation domain-containing protein